MMTTTLFAGTEEAPQITADRDDNPSWPITLTVASEGGEVRIYLDDTVAAALIETLGTAAEVATDGDEG